MGTLGHPGTRALLSLCCSYYHISLSLPLPGPDSKGSTYRRGPGTRIWYHVVKEQSWGLRDDTWREGLGHYDAALGHQPFLVPSLWYRSPHRHLSCVLAALAPSSCWEESGSRTNPRADSELVKSRLCSSVSVVLTMNENMLTEKEHTYVSIHIEYMSHMLTVNIYTYVCVGI